MALTRSQIVILLFASVALTGIAYTPGLTGGFIFDDYTNILQNAAVSEPEFTFEGLSRIVESGHAGPLKRPIPLLTFAVNSALHGATPFGFKLTNLFIHCVNGLLVYLLALRLCGLRSREMDIEWRDRCVLPSLFISAIWLAHPLNLTSVLYVVQRMNSLSATFVLLGLIAYCAARTRMMDGRNHGLTYLFIVFPICVACGALCKENALLAIPLAFVIEWCLIRRTEGHHRGRSVIIGFFAVALALPLLMLLGSVLLNPEVIVERYAGRPFTVYERLLTEARVLLFYVSLIVLPRIGEMGLFHDAFDVSSGLLTPLSTAPAVSAIVFFVGFSLLATRRYPLFCFGVLWFVVGHLLESTVIPLELVHEHRNYLPSIGIWFALGLGGIELLRRHAERWLVTMVAGVLICALLMITFIRAGDWSDPVTLATVEAERNPESFRAIYELGRIHYGLFLMSGEDRDRQISMKLMQRSAALDPNSKRPLLELLKIAYKHGEQPNQQWLSEAIQRYAESTFHHTDWIDLQSFVACHAERDCEIPHSAVVALYSAALGNIKTPQYYRAQMMIDLAVFYVNEFRDFAPALVLIDDAIALRPDEFDYYAVKADALMLAGKLDDAEAVIGHLRSSAGWADYVVTPAGRLDRIEARFMELSRQRSE